MKTDVLFILIIILFGVVAGDLFLNSLGKTIARQQYPMVEALEGTLSIQKDLQTKLSYRTGDVAAQMSRMDDQLVTMDKRLGEIENRLESIEKKMSAK